MIFVEEVVVTCDKLLGMMRRVPGFKKPVAGKLTVEVISETATSKCKATASRLSPDWDE